MSVSITNTGDLSHLSVLMQPFYMLPSFAGGCEAAAPLIGCQPCVLLPPHFAAMYFQAVHNTWSAEVDLTIQHSGSSRARSMSVYVRVGCILAITDAVQ